MSLTWLDVTAVGEVALEKDRVVLKVAGSDAVFVLKEDPKAKSGDTTVFAQMREAVERGEKKLSVFGRVEGWTGHWPKFLKAVPAKPRVILVKQFSAVK
jgi:hypothetical protein